MAKQIDPFARYTKATDQIKPRIIGASFGEVGCLTVDTPIAVRRQERHTRTIPLATLYDKFNGRWTRGRSYGYESYIQSFDNDRLFYNRIVAVTQSGVKPVRTVEFSDGTVLRGTPDHPVLTSNGFVEIDALTGKHQIIGRGSCLSRSIEERKGRAKRAEIFTKYHPYGGVKHVTAVERMRTPRTYEYRRVHRARLVLEALTNNLSYEEFIYILNTDAVRAATLRYIPPSYEVHHQDENAMNDEPGNLVLLTCSEHARLHSHRLETYKNYCVSKLVRKVTKQSPEMTYDVQMEAPAHNFCAGNTVVHNTGKTSFWLGAPGPIVVQTLDHGLEGVVEPYAKSKDIYVAEYDLGQTVGSEFSHAKAVEARDKFVEDFEHAIGVARTIIWDRESDVFPLFFFAEFGTDDAFGAAPPKDWDKLKGKIRRLIAMAKASDVNFGLIQGMKNEWVQKVNPKSGAKQAAQSGNRVRSGMDDIDALVHVNIEHKRIEGQFGITIGKCRGPGAADIQDQTFPGLSFIEFAQLVYPESEEGDWQ